MEELDCDMCDNKEPPACFHIHLRMHLTLKSCKAPQRRHLPLGICGTNQANFVLAAI